MTKQEVSDDGGMWKYFAPMLHMDDDDLNPYAYRLLGHYRRVCGANGGACTESVRTTAKRTQMSVGMVVKTRDTLIEKERIKVTIPVDPQGTLTITLLDCWEENIKRYSKRSSDKQGVHSMNGTVHVVNGGVHQVKQRITEEEKQENKKSRRRSFSPAKYTPSKASSPKVYQIVKHWVALNNPALFYADETETPAQALIDAHYEPETIIAILDWKASQNYLPPLRKVCSEIGAWIKEYERRAKSTPAQKQTVTAAAQQPPPVRGVDDDLAYVPPVTIYESEF